MKRTYLSFGKNENMLSCIAAGLFASLVVSVVLMIGLTCLIEKGKLNDNEYLAVFITRLIATIAGGLLSARLAEKKLLLNVVTTSAAYLLVLLSVGIVLFDGVFDKFWIGVLSVVIGVVIVLLIKLKPQTNRKKLTRTAR